MRSGPPFFFAVFVLLLAVIPARPATAAPRPDGPLVPDAGALFGEYIKPAEYERAVLERTIRDREADLGRRLDIAHWYYPWATPFPSWQEPWHLEAGRIPMISWQGTDTQEIAAGRHDALIETRADAVAALGAQVFLRFFWEMDGVANADRANSPADYIAAWRRIHGIFDARGADNVVWVWCPNAWGFHTGAAPQWYPGDDYVDWVCADGYNWAPGRAGDPWRSFTEIFAPFHEWGMARAKPMMVGEYGAQEREPGEKAQWFRDVVPSLQADLPGIAAVVYFDSLHDGYDWRVTTSAASYEAFHALAADPYLNTRPADVAAQAASSEQVARLAGADRITTAISISQADFADGAAGAVVLARADHYADALAGGPLAVATSAPLLLTAPDALPDHVLAEIRRVLARGGVVHLLGGANAIAPAVVARLEAAGYETVRHAGATRYATAVAVARDGLGNPDTLLLATGNDFADALSAGAAAGAVGAAVLLTDGGRLPAEVDAYLAQHDAATRYAIGGSAAKADPAATAISGPNRYATAARTAAVFFPAPRAVGVASGTNFPDAVAGAPHAARAGGPLLLTAPDRMPAASAEYVGSTEPDAIWLYGGERAISVAVQHELAQK
jgi:putative cell wall-binding protein